MKIVNRCPYCQKAVWGAKKVAGLESRYKNLCPHCDGEIVVVFLDRKMLGVVVLLFIVAATLPVFLGSSVVAGVVGLSDRLYALMKMVAACIYYPVLYLFFQRTCARYLVWSKPGSE